MTKSNLTSQGSHEVKIWPLRGLNQTSEIWFWNSDYIFGFLGPKNLLLYTPITKNMLKSNLTSQRSQEVKIWLWFLYQKDLTWAQATNYKQKYVIHFFTSERFWHDTHNVKNVKIKFWPLRGHQRSKFDLFRANVYYLWCILSISTLKSHET